MTKNIFFILTLSLCAIIGPMVLSNEGLLMNLQRDLLSPSLRHPFGFGENGIDIFTWLVYGLRTSLFIAVFCTLICFTIGTSVGTISGYVGGRFDQIIMRLSDVFLAFPGFILSVYISSVFVAGLHTMILALCVTGWIGFARLARAQVLEIKQREFVQASIALGAKPIRVLFRHIFPNILTPLLIQGSFTASSILLVESALSFLGLGLPPGTPSLGALLDQGAANLLIAPHIAVFSSIAIVICILSFQLLGESIRSQLSRSS